MKKSFKSLSDKEILPGNHSRRNFIKTGVVAGAMVPAVSLLPACNTTNREKEKKDTFVTTHEFDCLGMTGLLRLETEEQVGEGTSFAVEVNPFDRKKATVRIRLNSGKELTVHKFTIQVTVPNADVNRIWHTQQLDGLGHHAYISLPWGAEIDASGHYGCLLTALQDRYGNNRGLLALRDQSGDGSLRFSVQYGGPGMRMAINRFVHGGVWHTDSIDETAYVDFEDVPWNHAVKAFTVWYDQEFQLHYNTPSFCWEPAFNTWYPLKNKQREELVLKLARQCQELGIKTFEIDAGWFTNTGTWEPDTEKIPDLKGLIGKLHDLGLRVIIWFNAFNAGDREELKHLCVVNDGKRTNKLCPANPEVRERGARLVKELMQEYGLDGLKMDFLDTGGVPMQQCEAGHEHSYEFVSDGVNQAMAMMSKAIRDVKQDAIIEYRLNYATVATRRYATMFRGQDAPSDPDHVRRHLALLRAWSHGLAVHADYAYWTGDMSMENVAKFLAGMVFYGVPTISMDFDELPEKHFQLTKTWLAFYRKHINRFREGQLDHLSDDFHYSTCRVSSGGITYISCFLRDWPSTLPVFPEHAREVYLANMTAHPRVFTRLENLKGTYSATVLDLMLEEKYNGLTFVSNGAALDIDSEIPVGGLMVLRKK